VAATTADRTDEAFMRTALGLAARGLGRTWPNPTVGCVLVQGGVTVGRGWTQAGGRPHAETEALARAGSRARGSTAYVSLEPCAHHGQTPPCAEALIAAGIGRAVVALRDPYPRVAGRGLQALADAGIAVDTGLCEAAAAEVNAGFLMRLAQGRPLVTLKLASSLDGRIATHGGESRWITGEASRQRAHLLRAQNDAVLIGAGTAIADDPELTVRLAGMAEFAPIRIVVDGRLRLSLTSGLVRTAKAHRTWLFTLAVVDAARRHAYVDAGVDVITVDPDAGGLVDLRQVLRILGERGLTRVLVEGGGRLAASLARADLVDRIAWFRAGAIIGGDGLPAVAGFGLDRLAGAPRFRRTGWLATGDDILETYSRHG